MNRYVFFAVIIILFTKDIFSQSGTFDFETATSSGSPKSVTQTVGSRTITISSSVDFNALDPITFGLTVNGITGKTAINDGAMTQNITITFSGIVNIVSLKVYEGCATNNPGTMTFVPTGGSNSTINYAPSPNSWDNNCKLVTLNWVGITAINITAPYSFYWGFDDIVMDAALPVELITFNASLNKNVVTLTWKTSTEVNNYGFEVERKNSTSQNWEKIGFVQGHGNSNSPKEYTFIDKSPSSGNLKYRLKQIDTDGAFEYYLQIAEVNYSITSVEEKQLPTEFALEQNYPNPFNPSTKIKYSIPKSENVVIKVYDVLGTEIKTLVNDYQNTGSYEVEFNASDLPSGLYFYNIISGDFKETRKMIFIK